MILSLIINTILNLFFVEMNFLKYEKSIRLRKFMFWKNWTKLVLMRHMLKIDWNVLKFKMCELRTLKKKNSTWRWFRKTLKNSRKELKLLKKILKRSSRCWKKNSIKLKNWEKINEIFIKFQKMLLCWSMKIMKLLKITSWTFALIITLLKMSLSLLKLKIENCEMLHERKIFEINKLKKTFLTKIQRFRLKETSLMLLIIEINCLRTSSSLIKLTIKDRIN